jgi:hypothetical protein
MTPLASLSSGCSPRCHISKDPLVEDWVNACDMELERRTDSTKPGSVRENDEILWREFETAFKAAWTDTAKVQSAYSQLMKLQMKDLDIDTYNATFARLANAAGWEEDAKGDDRSLPIGPPRSYPTPYHQPGHNARHYGGMADRGTKRSVEGQGAPEFGTHRTSPEPDTT